MEEFVNIYVELMTSAVPYALTIWICDMIATTLMRAISGGYLGVSNLK